MAHPDNKPPLSDAPISMVLPVRDQVSVLERAASAWLKALRALDRRFQLLIIDDGSTDDTGSRAANLAAQHSEIEVTRHEKPQGFGACLRTALPKLQHPLVFITALDYPYTTSDFRKLLERIDDCDLVSGFRAAVRPPRWYAVYRGIVDRLLRILIGFSREPLPGWLGWKVHVYNRLMRTILGTQLDDVESAYKLIRREVLEGFPIQSDGIFALTEIVAKANFLTLWLDEVPIGAQSGVAAEALRIPWNWRERRRDFFVVFRKPEFISPIARPEREADRTTPEATTPVDRPAPANPVEGSPHLEAPGAVP